MERLLLLRLRSLGCGAEVRVNDMAVARTPERGGAICLPVHEYLLEGNNELALVVGPGPVAEPDASAQRVASGVTGAGVRLLLPRTGAVGNEQSARTLAEIDWAVAELQTYSTPAVQRGSIVLPVKFPRWRWLDMPVIDSSRAVHTLVAGFVQTLAVSLAKGDAETFLQAARLRFEELALAYQRPAADLAARWRDRIQMLHATKALKPVLPALADVVLRPCAGGRLLECLSPAGEPALRTEPAADGTRQAWPIRVAVIDGRCHIVR